MTIDPSARVGWGIQEMKKLSVFFLAVIFVLFGINLAGGINDLGSMSLLRDFSVNAWGVIQLCLFKTEAYGGADYRDVYRLGNGYTVNPDTDPNMDGLYEGVTELKSFGEEYDIPVLFVNGALKQCGSKIPFGITDHGPGKYDLACRFYEQAGVDCIDTLKLLQSEDRDYLSFFYKSDHHWNNDAAYICTRAIVDRIKRQGINIGDISTDSFNKYGYNGVHLGSSGRFAGKIYGGIDDYTLWVPFGDTDYSLYIPGTGEKKTGSFSDCIVSFENLDGYSFDRYGYYAYFGTDRDYTEIVNESNPDMANVVVIKDSYAVPVVAMLSAACHEIDMIDLRYTGDDDIKSYIISKEPDMIIYIFEPGNYGDRGAMVIR